MGVLNMKRLSFMLAAVAGLAISASSALADSTIKMVEVITSPPRTEFLKKQIAEFEAANPGTTIQIEVVPWDNLQQKLTTDISAGTNADLSIIGTRWLLDYVSQDVVAPLDEYMTPEIKGRFIETFYVESWLEHLRQHASVTETDRLLQEEIAQLLVGPEPVTTHLIAAEP